MFVKKFSVLCGLPLISAFTVPLSIAAPKSDVLEEITVTASKREQSIYEVPIAVSAFEGDKLANQGIVDIVDVGKFVPNLNITQFSAGHISSANPFIRGIGLQDHLITTDPGVSVYVDGVYLGRQVGQNWNLANIERVEVLRGPQGTLYGRNSIGGAINIITQEPGDTKSAKVSVEAGTRDRLNGDLYANIPLTEQLAVSFNAGYKSRGGVGEFTNLPNARVDVGETEETFGRVALKYSPSDSLTILLAADSNSGEGGLRPYETLIDELPNGAVYQAGIRNADEASDPYDNATGQDALTLVTNDAEGASLTVDWQWSEQMSTKFIASQRSSEYQAGLDDDSVEENFLAFPEQGSADQKSFEVQFNGDMGAWDFVSGVYYFEEEGKNEQFDTYFNSFGPGTFYLTQEVTSFAVYGNVGLQLSDALRLSGGLRYTEDEKDAETNVGNGLFKSSRDFDEISWDLSATYTLNSGLSVYAATQSGYQSGQFPARPYCLFGDPTCFVASDNITAVNYELGIKGELAGALQFGIAVFLTDYDDLPYQVSETTAVGFNTTNLIVTQQSTGLEFEGTWAVTDNFFIHSSLGYIDVQVDKQDGVQAVAPLTPEITFSLSPEFNIALAGGGSVSARIDYSFRDEMYGEPSDDPGRLTLIDSRDLLNASISYTPADEGWSVALYGRNITDERYDNARLNTGDYVLRILSNDPSEFGLRVSANF